MNESWPLLVGAAMWVVLIVCSVLYWVRRPAPNPDACPECGHETGLDLRRAPHCANVDDGNGWSSDRCDCQNDYHWNYESTAV